MLIAVVIVYPIVTPTRLTYCAREQNLYFTSPNNQINNTNITSIIQFSGVSFILFYFTIIIIII